MATTGIIRPFSMVDNSPVSQDTDTCPRPVSTPDLTKLIEWGRHVVLGGVREDLAGILLPPPSRSIRTWKSALIVIQQTAAGKKSQHAHVERFVEKNCPSRLFALPLLRRWSRALAGRRWRFAHHEMAIPAARSRRFRGGNQRTILIRILQSEVSK